MRERYLVSLSLGPVQDFIAAALRTRDLWMGSWMLSEVSKSAAHSMQQSGAKLIFPATNETEDLQPGSDLNVANRILAEVEGMQSQAVSVLEDAKAAAKARWQQFVEDAQKEYSKRVPNIPLRQNILKAQEGDMLEFFSSWMQREGSYLEARYALDALTAARKNSRDFIPAARSADEAPFYGLPKSSLDARRETILPDGLSQTQRRKIRLGEGEQLDLAGLVKRLAESDRSQQFSPVSRIALDAWVQDLDADDQKQLHDDWEDAKKVLGDTWITRVVGNGGLYDEFPYDGNLLYRDHLAATLRRLKNEDARDKVQALQRLKKQLAPLYREYGEPTGYYALLMADGDRMGQLLDQAKDAEAHRNISTRLADFAADVEGIVQKYRGHCVYAGGDDVLALLPVDLALDCADVLRQHFADFFLAFCKEGHDSPTLSAGIAVAHVLEPLGRVRQWAVAAEKTAKEGLSVDEMQKRNALALFLYSRSGSPLYWRGRWDADGHKDLRRWQDYFANNQVSSKLPYELRDLLSSLGIQATADSNNRVNAALRKVLVLDVQRVLKRKQPDGTQISESVQKALIEDFEKLADKPQQFVTGLLIGRWLAAKEEA